MKLGLTFSYDGSEYQGFQKQPHGLAVQNILEKALTKLFLKPIATVSAGRTDSGVHADEHLIMTEVPDVLAEKIGLIKLPQILNHTLPRTIHIIRCFPVPATFHPRYQACVRVYRYSIYTPTYPSLPSANLTKSFLYTFPLQRELLGRILHAFEGTHDFTTFASSRDSNLSKIRTLYKVDCREQGDEVIIELYGNAFLREMVRSIIGNALLLMRTEQSADKVSELLAHRNPKLARARVPGHALTLTRIFYTPLFPKPNSGKRLVWT